MKTLIALLLPLSIQAGAATYSYDCHLTTDRDQKITFDLHSRAMKLHDQYRIVSMKPYKVKRGWALLENKGLKGGKGKMKDRLYFAVNYDKSEVVSETTDHFYLEPELIKGGRVMKNGKQGGFVSFEGGGYSYESYVCYVK